MRGLNELTIQRVIRLPVYLCASTTFSVLRTQGPPPIVTLSSRFAGILRGLRWSRIWGVRHCVLQVICQCRYDQRVRSEERAQREACDAAVGQVVVRRVTVGLKCNTVNN